MRDSQPISFKDRTPDSLRLSVISLSGARMRAFGEAGAMTSGADMGTDVLVKAEVALRLERQLDAAQQITHIGSWEWDLTTGAVTWSDELYRIYGLAPRAWRSVRP